MKNNGLVEPVERGSMINALRMNYTTRFALPKGEYPVSRIPFASQYAFSLVSGIHGCICTWFVTGMTLQCGSRVSRCLIEKLDTPMLLTFPACAFIVSKYAKAGQELYLPVSSSFSISFQVSTNVGDSCASKTRPNDNNLTIRHQFIPQRRSTTSIRTV